MNNVNTNQTNTNNVNDKKGYFDSRLSGFSYLQRAREVFPKKGSSYMAVTVVIVQGKVGDTNNLYVDCNVVGTEAEMLIRDNVKSINNKEIKVSARAITSDLYTEGFIYGDKHVKAGQPGASMKGRLLKLTCMKVDGELVSPLIEDAKYGTEYWPTEQFVKIDHADGDIEEKSNKLTSLGYVFNQITGAYFCSSEYALSQLAQRKQAFEVELNQPANQAHQ